MINTDDGSITQCPAQAIRPANAPATHPIQFDVIPAVPGARPIAVFSLDRLTVQAGGRVVGLGNRALAIQSRGDVVVNGAIIVAGGPTACSVQAACANGAGGTPTCAGPGGGAGHLVTIGTDGPGTGGFNAGGGFGGVGGQGGGASYAVPASGLIGGSGGGEGSVASGGGGGGALQISTQTRIEVGGAQGILACGMGGTESQPDMFDVLYSGAGGGAGGLVVLDAPTVHVNAFVLANGGGGGGGGGQASDALAPSFQSTRQPGGYGGSDGGAGGGFGILNGESTVPVPMGGSGGGGGGAGYLRIFTATGGYVHGGAAVISPDPALGTAVIQ